MSSMDSKERIKFELQNFGDDDGVHLTWQDLCVSIFERVSGSTKTILEDVTGYACPGQVLAIMGPSGCGKSTLLDALAGRLELSTNQTGKILINGCRQTLPHGTLAYVTQDNILMMTLTVRETMYYSSELLLPSSMSKLEKQKRAEECIKEMGLQDAIDTRVGGWGVKGLSGGEKKRLSLCIELLNHPKVLFLDEPTTGLDSAASLHVMNRIIGKGRTIGRTIIASIHQPSSQVFGLFDNLCLLSAGKTVYFGPTSETNEFFTSNGFPCPSLQNPSDHFLQMINKDFDEVNARVIQEQPCLQGFCEHSFFIDGNKFRDFYQDIEQDFSTSRKTMLETINILVNSYNSSECHQQAQDVINSICKQKANRLEMRTRASFSVQCQVITRRSFVNMSRDWGYYWLRLIIYIVLGLGLGHLFFNLELNFGSLQARITVIMFVVAYLTGLAMGGFLSLIEEMKVFERERLNGHYCTTSYTIGNTLSSMPFLLLISFLAGAITYFPPGLSKEYHKFLYFLLILFTSSMLVESLMMIVASLVPNLLMGGITGGGIQGLMILSAGFIRLPNDLPRFFWRYPLYYVSFHRYAYQGLVKNEFGGLKIPIVIGTSSNVISGDSIIKTILQVDTNNSKWIDLAILISMVIIYRVLFIFIITIFDKLKPLIRARVEAKVTNASNTYYVKKSN